MRERECERDTKKETIKAKEIDMNIYKWRV